MNTTESDQHVKTVTVVHFVNIKELSQFVKIVITRVCVNTRESKGNVDCAELAKKSKSKEWFIIQRNMT